MRWLRWVNITKLKFCWRCFWLLVSLGSLPHVVLAGTPSVVELLREAGMEPLPNLPAPAFKLPVLNPRSFVKAPGKTVLSLTDLRGKWVLLTFFATWCGPCALEMPALQALAAEFKQAASNLVVIALAPEGDTARLEAYRQQYGLDFPVLVDSQGAVATAYQATNIPLSYLLNPAGEIVARVQGAHDWLKSTKYLKALVTGAFTPGAQALAKSKVPLPQQHVEPNLEPSRERVPAESLEPPRVTLNLFKRIKAQHLAGPLSPLSPLAIIKDEPFTLALQVQFKAPKLSRDLLPGASQTLGITAAYPVLKPPELALPAGLSLIRVFAASRPDPEGEALTYYYELVAETPGTLTLPALALHYSMQGQEKTLPLAGLTLTVHNSRLGYLWQQQVLAVFTNGKLFKWPVIMGSFSALLVLSGLVGTKLWRLVKRRARGQEEPAREERSLKWREKFALLQRLRLDGQSLEFVRGLLDLAREYQLPPHQLEILEALLERMRYGQIFPNSQELGDLERQLYRALVAQLESRPKEGVDEGIEECLSEGELRRASL